MNMDHRSVDMDHRYVYIDNRFVNIVHRSVDMDHRSVKMDHRSVDMDHRSVDMDLWKWQWANKRRCNKECDVTYKERLHQSHLLATRRVTSEIRQTAVSPLLVVDGLCVPVSTVSLRSCW